MPLQLLNCSTSTEGGGGTGGGGTGGGAAAALLAPWQAWTMRF